eukprot:9484026-Pyramimonas_sp.AAC.1
MFSDCWLKSTPDLVSRIVVRASWVYSFGHGVAVSLIVQRSQFDRWKMDPKRSGPSRRCQCPSFTPVCSSPSRARL